MAIKSVKIVVGVPETHADAVRKAMGDAGAGKIGDYSHCSFSAKGVGRFIPLDSAKPSIGEIGKLEEVPEEQIETVCLKKDLDKVIDAIKRVHPYEEIAISIYPLAVDPEDITHNQYRRNK